MNTLNKQKNKNRYLLDYRKDIASQFGEDGIIEKIFEILLPSNKWCIEFGAWDGEHFSNTYNLIQHHGWSGILVGGDASRMSQIRETHAGKLVTAVNAFVASSGPSSLNNLLSATDAPQDFDLLSIDIDGNDYHVWRGLTDYKPKVVVIEFNSFIPGNIEFVQEDSSAIVHGNSILSMTMLAKEKGYKLICINQENAFFVDAQYFNLFNIDDNSIEALKHYKEPLQVFQLYDGTFRFHGAQGMYYYGFPVDLNKRFQIFPAWLRRRGVLWKGGNWFTKLAIRFYRRINRAPITDIWEWKNKY